MFDPVNGTSVSDSAGQAVGERARKPIVAPFDLEKLFGLSTSAAAKLTSDRVLVQYVEKRSEPRNGCVAEVHHVERRVRYALSAQILIACDAVVFPERLWHPCGRKRIADLVGERSDVPPPYFRGCQPLLVRRDARRPLKGSVGEDPRSLAVGIPD